MKSIYRRVAACLLPLLFLAQCDKIPKFGESAAEGEAGSAEVVRELDATQFDAFTSIKDKLIVVDFYADWCGPCKDLGPKLESVAGEFDGDVLVGKINVDNARNLTARMGVRGIPDVRIFRNGSQVESFVGSIPRSEIRSKLKGHVSLLSGAGTDAAGEGGPEEEVSSEPIQPMTKDWMPEGMQKR